MTVVTVGSNAATAAVTAVAAAVAGASQQKKVSKQVINQAINLYSPMQLQASKLLYDDIDLRQNYGTNIGPHCLLNTGSRKNHHNGKAKLKRQITSK